MTNHLRIAAMLVAVVAGMTGLSFAAKPMYDTFCRVTGFGGTTRQVETYADRVLDRKVTVRLDTNVADVPLRFQSEEISVKAKLGESVLTYFDVTNTSDQPVTAVASYNVTPHKAGPYFAKIECFCFDDMVFQPGETVALPVLFFVNPDMADERQLDDVKTITLSYTYFRSKADGAPVASLASGLASQ